MKLRRIWRRWMRSIIKRDLSHYSDFIGAELATKYVPAFFPNSANANKAPSLAFSGANVFPEQLFSLLNTVGMEPCVTESVQEYGDGYSGREIADLFEKYGSNKQECEYQHAYARILSTMRDAPVRLLEIGLGTNNPAMLSSMGIHGKPGASLRAFRDYLGRAEILGADFDKDILFREERIETAFVDQLTSSTFSGMHAAFANKHYDVFIDDGLHCPEANFNALAFALRNMNDRGVIVIEDIVDDSLPVWNVIGSILRNCGGGKYKPYILTAKNINMFVVHCSVRQ